MAQVLGAVPTQPPPKRLKKAKAVVAPPASAAKELTLEEALAPFAGLKPIPEAPEWLEGGSSSGHGPPAGRGQRVI